MEAIENLTPEQPEETGQSVDTPNEDIYTQMDDILAGVDEPEQDEPEQDEPEQNPAENEPEQNPAEKPEIDYTKEFDVPMPEGVETATIGQLKDAYIEQQRTQNTQTAQANDIMRARGQLTELIEAFGQGKVNPKAIEMLEQQKSTVLARENELMMESIPEWKEPTTFQGDRTEMLEVTAEYGLDENDLNSVNNHKWIKMIRDYTKLKAQFKKTQQSFEKNKKNNRRPPKPTKARAKQQAFEHAVNSTSQSEKLQAIDDLLK